MLVFSYESGEKMTCSLDIRNYKKCSLMCGSFGYCICSQKADYPQFDHFCQNFSVRFWQTIAFVTTRPIGEPWHNMIKGASLLPSSLQPPPTMNLQPFLEVLFKMFSFSVGKMENNNQKLIREQCFYKPTPSGTLNHAINGRFYDGWMLVTLDYRLEEWGSIIIK